MKNRIVILGIANVRVYAATVALYIIFAVKRLKTILLICGSLCLLGFFGTALVNGNHWYLVPLGYGLGAIIVCIEMLSDFKTIK